MDREVLQIKNFICIKNIFTSLPKSCESDAKVYELKHNMHLSNEILRPFQSSPRSTIHTDFSEIYL